MSGRWIATFLLSVLIIFSGGLPLAARGEIVSVQAVSQSLHLQQSVPMTFGEVFRAGDVPAGTHLTATLRDQTIPIQVDRKATYADGSLRHAVITVVLPDLQASAKRLIMLSAGAAPSRGEAVSLDDVLATSFDARVSLNVNGTTYVASARDFLERARDMSSCRPWGNQCNVWLSGPQVSEWIVGGPVATPGGSVNPHLAAYFYVRAYRGDPITRIRVNVVIENTWSYVANPHNIAYDAILTVGANEYKKETIKHYAHARWHRVMWWRDRPQVYAKLDSRYIQSTKAVSQYADVQPTDELLDSVRQHVDPMSNGDITENMGDQGAQDTIGPLPRWTSAYLLSMDSRAFNWMLANDDAAGSYDIYYRDQNTGRPISLLNYPYMTLLGHWGDTRNRETGEHEAFPDCGDCWDPNRPDTAHEPSVGFLSYIVTGDFYYLEQLQFWADWNAFRQNPHYRGKEKGLLINQQVRGQAWALRTLGDAAWITPDDDPLKPYFVGMIQNNIAWYNQHYTNNPDANSLHAVTHGVHSIVYDNHTSIAPWQDDFFTWSIGHLADLGFSGAEELLRWKGQFVVDRMADPGFCWLLAAAYNMRVRDAETAPLYTSVAQIYKNQFTGLAGIACNSPEMAQHLGVDVGEMTGYAWSPTGFPSNMQPALAVAVDYGLANAAVGWSTFENRSVQPDYSDYANFAVVPRVVQESANPQPEPRIDFYADPNPVTPGQSTTLHWRAEDATSCNASWMSGNEVEGEKVVGPISGAINYSIECIGPGGTADASVQVTDTTVKRPTVSLEATPPTLRAGQVTVLAWDSTDADLCMASGGWSGSVSTRGQQTVGPLDVDTDFELACRGAGGDAETTVTVRVESAVGDSAPQSPPTQEQSVDQEETGGGGALGGVACLWLLGVALIVQRRRF